MVKPEEDNEKICDSKFVDFYQISNRQDAMSGCVNSLQWVSANSL